MRSSEVKEIAQQACKYARQRIKKGYTQLEFNDYTRDQQGGVLNAVTLMRDLSKDIYSNNLRLEQSNQLFDFLRWVDCAEKYALGNCDELAMTSLYYVMKTNPRINAERFQIINGNHSFSVIGRDPNSSPEDPSTWGKTAYICDPWSKDSKQRVYPANQYLARLKTWKLSHTSTSQYHINTVEDFNLAVHKLDPHYSIHTLYAGDEAGKIRKITRVFKAKMLIIKTTLITLRQSLKDIIEEKPSTHSNEIQTLERKIKSIESIIHSVDRDIQHNFKQENYILHRIELREKLTVVIYSVQTACIFSKQDSRQLDKNKALMEAISIVYRSAKDSIDLLDMPPHYLENQGFIQSVFDNKHKTRPMHLDGETALMIAAKYQAPGSFLCLLKFELGYSDFHQVIPNERIKHLLCALVSGVMRYDELISNQRSLIPVLIGIIEKIKHPNKLLFKYMLHKVKAIMLIHYIPKAAFPIIDKLSQILIKSWVLDENLVLLFQALSSFYDYYDSTAYAVFQALFSSVNNREDIKFIRKILKNTKEIGNDSLEIDGLAIKKQLREWVEKLPSNQQKCYFKYIMVTPIKKPGLFAIPQEVKKATSSPTQAAAPLTFEVI